MVKKALLIGIDYIGVTQNGQSIALNGCIDDIQNINQFLTNNCGYSPQNVAILTDQMSVTPTLGNIEAYINWLISGSMPGDTLFFYYSGHGAAVQNNSSNESDGQTEVMVPLDFQTAGVITDDWLFTNFAVRIPAGVNLWAFMDCCHSGTMMDLKYNYKSNCQYKKGAISQNMPFVNADWTYQFALSYEPSADVTGNVCMFSGCLDNETSADAYEGNQYQGAFTYCLLSCLKSKLVNNRFPTGTVRVLDILKEVNARLHINGFTGQDSQFSCHNTSDFMRTFDP